MKPFCQSFLDEKEYKELEEKGVFVEIIYAEDQIKGHIGHNYNTAPQYFRLSMAFLIPMYTIMSSKIVNRYLSRSIQQNRSTEINLKNPHCPDQFY